jgi:hypothetical protein
MADLSNVQAEIRTVKQALNNGTPYLGMKGDKLQEYFLQLNVKENIHLQNLSGGSASPFLTGPSPTAGYARGGVQPAAARLAAALPPQPAAAQPAGPAPAFDRNDLRAVIEHMCAWEAVDTESGKALKALASLAYSSTQQVTADPTALGQVLRLMQLHPGSSLVQLYAVQSICNMADDQTAALGPLSQPIVLTGLVSALGRTGASANLDAKATEAIARIVAASENDATGQLAKVFCAVIGSGSHEACAPNVMQICDQLVKNEVTDPKKIAEACMTASAAARQTTLQAAGWLELAKCLSADKMTISLQQTSLVSAGAINMSVSLMETFVKDADVQLTGIETLSSLVGIFLEALEVFAKAGGLRQIECTLREHADNLPIQMKGIRALSSGAAWSRDMQEKSGYSWKNAVQITRNAMLLHAREVDLTIAGLELLVKCLENLPIADQVKAEFGGDLVLTAMRTHDSSPKVKNAGTVILRHFNIDPNAVA